MPRTTKPLNNTEVSKAKSKDKDYKLADGQGLYLLVKSTGIKLWRFNYVKPVTNKRTDISLGIYPEVTLADARRKKEEYRSLLTKGIDPLIHRQEIAQNEMQKNTLLSVAEQWKEKYKEEVEPLTLEKNWLRLNKHIFAKIGQYPISDINPRLLVETLKPLDLQGINDTLHRLIRLVNKILNHAVNIGLIEFNYCEKVGQAFRKVQQKNNPTISPDELPALLQKIFFSNLNFKTKMLIQWQLLTMVRPAEAVSVEWSEIDFDKKCWNIPAEKMKKTHKGQFAHVVPLSTQALQLLDKMKLITGSSRFFFPNNNQSKFNQSMSKETANKALNTLGYQNILTAHGLRSIARTYLSSQGVSYEIAETCLAHAVGSSTSRVYNNYDYFKERISAMQLWSDYIEKCTPKI
ncbi:tyrosine-type recombinase/integrase [Lonepinella sp. BR2919]|uniref:tyrosine-type recombinase/integrase n=1 Tax=unclassified Lonepinella TaxID=2642006 RepID=UPI003F6DCEF2